MVALHLPHLPTNHTISSDHARALTDAPRLLACIHRYRSSSTSSGGAIAAAAPGTAAPPAHSSSSSSSSGGGGTSAVYVVEGPAVSDPPAAYVLSEASSHGGPRWGLICATAHGDPPKQAHRGSEAALGAIAALRLDTLRFFGLPAVAVETADELLPSRGYRRTYHNPCVQHVLRGPLPEAALQRWRAEGARLGKEGYQLSRLQLSDAELVDSLW
jgi:hypothetical protein